MTELFALVSLQAAFIFLVRNWVVEKLGEEAKAGYTTATSVSTYGGVVRFVVKERLVVG